MTWDIVIIMFFWNLASSSFVMAEYLAAFDNPQNVVVIWSYIILIDFGCGLQIYNIVGETYADFQESFVDGLVDTVAELGALALLVFCTFLGVALFLATQAYVQFKKQQSTDGSGVLRPWRDTVALLFLPPICCVLFAVVMQAILSLWESPTLFELGFEGFASGMFLGAILGEVKVTISHAICHKLPWEGGNLEFHYRFFAHVVPCVSGIMVGFILDNFAISQYHVEC